MDQTPAIQIQQALQETRNNTLIYKPPIDQIVSLFQLIRSQKQNLRKIQSDIAFILAQWSAQDSSGLYRIILDSPTGTGKTIQSFVCMYLANQCIIKPDIPGFFITINDLLCQQAYSACGTFFGNYINYRILRIGPNNALKLIKIELGIITEEDFSPDIVIQQNIFIITTYQAFAVLFDSRYEENIKQLYNAKIGAVMYDEMDTFYNSVTLVSFHSYFDAIPINYTAKLQVFISATISAKFVTEDPFFKRERLYEFIKAQYKPNIQDSVQRESTTNRVWPKQKNQEPYAVGYEQLSFPNNSVWNKTVCNHSSEPCSITAIAMFLNKPELFDRHIVPTNFAKENQETKNNKNILVECTETPFPVHIDIGSVAALAINVTRFIDYDTILTYRTSKHDNALVMYGNTLLPIIKLPECADYNNREFNFNARNNSIEVSVNKAFQNINSKYAQLNKIELDKPNKIDLVNDGTGYSGPLDVIARGVDIDVCRALVLLSAINLKESMIGYNTFKQLVGRVSRQLEKLINKHKIITNNLGFTTQCYQKPDDTGVVKLYNGYMQFIIVTDEKQKLGDNFRIEYNKANGIVSTEDLPDNIDELINKNKEKIRKHIEKHIEMYNNEFKEIYREDTKFALLPQQKYHTKYTGIVKWVEPKEQLSINSASFYSSLINQLIFIANDYNPQKIIDYDRIKNEFKNANQNVKIAISAVPEGIKIDDDPGVIAAKQHLSLVTAVLEPTNTEILSQYKLFCSIFGLNTQNSDEFIKILYKNKYIEDQFLNQYTTITIPGPRVQQTALYGTNGTTFINNTMCDQDNIDPKNNNHIQVPNSILPGKTQIPKIEDCPVVMSQRHILVPLVSRLTKLGAMVNGADGSGANWLNSQRHEIYEIVQNYEINPYQAAFHN